MVGQNFFSDIIEHLDAPDKTFGAIVVDSLQSGTTVASSEKPVERRAVKNEAFPEAER